MKRLLLIALFGLGSAAQAQERGPFVGLSFGSFDYEEDDPLVGLRISDRPGAYRLFGGYQFSEHLVFEGGWGATDDIKESFTIVDPLLGDARFDATVEYEALTLRVLGMLPLRRVTVFGGIGYYDADLDESGTFVDETETVTYTIHENDSGAALVGGAQFDRKRFSIRVEYEWLDADSSFLGDDSSVDAWGINAGLLYRF